MDRDAPGKAPLLRPEQRVALAQALEAGPTPERHGVVRWRPARLAWWLRDEFGVSLSRQTLGRELRRMGIAKLSARPRARAIARSRAGPRGARGVQKHLPAEREAIRATLPPEAAIELWWQDEARVGQKSGITRRRARRATRPRAPHDQRTQWALAIVLGPMADDGSLFGAICPAKGKAAGLVMSCANTEAMQAHLDPALDGWARSARHALHVGR